MEKSGKDSFFSFHSSDVNRISSYSTPAWAKINLEISALPREFVYVNLYAEGIVND